MNAILMGMAISQAYTAESDAPPLGVVIHESARGLAPSNDPPLSFVFWKWFDEADTTQRAKIDALRWHLLDQFKWLEANHREQMYSLEALKRHRDACTEYFQLQ
jgi:hypothetical protein